jgi:hypothetical protein
MKIETLSFAAISALGKDQAVALAVNEDNRAKRAFVTVAKVMIALGKDGAEMLRKAGISKPTIDAARYAAKAWATVESGQLTEEKFDGMSFSDMVGMVQHVIPAGKDAIQAVADAPDASVAIDAALPVEKQKATKKAAKASAKAAKVTPAPAVAVAAPVTPAAPAKPSSVPSESDLIESLGIIEKGILARVAAGEDVGSVYARVLFIADKLTEAGLTPSPVEMATA